MGRILSDGPWLQHRLLAQARQRLAPRASNQGSCARRCSPASVRGRPKPPAAKRTGPSPSQQTRERRRTIVQAALRQPSQPTETGTQIRRVGARSLATVDHTALRDRRLGSQVTHRSSIESTLFSIVRTLAKASKFWRANRGANGDRLRGSRPASMPPSRVRPPQRTLPARAHRRPGRPVGRSFLGGRPRRRVGTCLPQLPRPRARRLGRGVPRGQLPRLAAVKNTYDPHRFFDFPQAI